MNETELVVCLLRIIKFIIAIYGIIIFAFIVQLIANLIIAIKLPKITKKSEEIVEQLNEIQLQNRNIHYTLDKIEQNTKENK